MNALLNAGLASLPLLAAFLAALSAAIEPNPSNASAIPWRLLTALSLLLFATGFFVTMKEAGAAFSAISLNDSSTATLLWLMMWGWMIALLGVAVLMGALFSAEVEFSSIPSHRSKSPINLWLILTALGMLRLVLP